MAIRTDLIGELEDIHLGEGQVVLFVVDQIRYDYRIDGTAATIIFQKRLHIARLRGKDLWLRYECETAW